MSLVKAREKRGEPPNGEPCGVGASVVGIRSHAPMPGSPHTTTGLKEIVDHGDAPACIHCGSVTQRSGSCYCCMNCGSTSGCS